MMHFNKPNIYHFSYQLTYVYIANWYSTKRHDKKRRNSFTILTTHTKDSVPFYVSKIP